MTVKTSSPRSRWPRFLPKRFSLRSLLIIVTSASIFFGWALQRPRGVITERQLTTLKKGMTKTQVSWRYGNPIGGTMSGIWAYDIQDRPNHSLFISFDAQEDRVFSFFVQVNQQWVEDTEPSLSQSLHLE